MSEGPRMNRRGWHVVDSTESADRQYCVDLFVDAAGAFGWAHFRADPEDGGAWTILSRSADFFGSEAGARRAAIAEVVWLHSW